MDLMLLHLITGHSKSAMGLAPQAVTESLVGQFTGFLQYAIRNSDDIRPGHEVQHVGDLNAISVLLCFIGCRGCGIRAVMTDVTAHYSFRA